MYSSQSILAGLREVAASVLANPASVSIQTARDALQFPDQPRQSTDDELHIIAFLTSRVNRERIDLTTLEPFKNFLAKKADIKRLCAAFSRIHKAETGLEADFMANKHAISCSRLEYRREEYMNAIQLIISELNLLDIKAAVCYGTLLGAERAGSFIPHDDDVDVIYFDGSSSEKEARENAAQLASRLQDRGFKYYMHGFNFIVNVNGTEIDLFPSWQTEDKIFLLMENFIFRPVPISMMLPLGSVRLYDRSFPAPAARGMFLEERYGHTWQTPDVFSEWPWQLFP